MLPMEQTVTHLTVHEIASKASSLVAEHTMVIEDPRPRVDRTWEYPPRVAVGSSGDVRVSLQCGGFLAPEAALEALTAYQEALIKAIGGDCEVKRQGELSIFQAGYLQGGKLTVSEWHFTLFARGFEGSV